MLDNFQTHRPLDYNLQQSQFANNALIAQIEKQNNLIHEALSKLSQNEQQQYNSPRHYQFQPQTQLIPPPIPPPPIFLPPNFSFLERQQQEKQQQEKLRMLILMKRLREENFLLRMQLEQKQDKSASSISQSSHSSAIRIRQAPKPKQGPDKRDLELAQQELADYEEKRKQLVFASQTRKKLLLKRLVIKIRASMARKSKKFTDSFPQDILDFQAKMFQWMKFTDPIDQNMKTQKGLIFQCDKKTGTSEKQKRNAELKRYLKQYFEKMMENIPEFPQDCIEYLQYFTHSFYTTPPNFLLKFEINRLKFTPGGGTILDQQKGPMMLITIVWIRYFMNYLHLRWEPVDQKDKTYKQNQQYLLNLHTLISAMYEIVMDYLRGTFAEQKDNLKHVPLERQPTHKAGEVYKLRNFEERESDKVKIQNLKEGDEPLLYPLLSKDEMSAFFSDYKNVQELGQYIEGWVDQIYNLVDIRRKTVLYEELNEFKAGQKAQLEKNTKTLDKQIKEMDEKIIELQDKVKQMRNFLNLSMSHNKSRNSNKSKIHSSSRQQQQ